MAALQSNAGGEKLKKISVYGLVSSSASASAFRASTYKISSIGVRPTHQAPIDGLRRFRLEHLLPNATKVVVPRSERKRSLPPLRAGHPTLSGMSQHSSGKWEVPVRCRQRNFLMNVTLDSPSDSLFGLRSENQKGYIGTIRGPFWLGVGSFESLLGGRSVGMGDQLDKNRSSGGIHPPIGLGVGPLEPHTSGLPLGTISGGRTPTDWARGGPIRVVYLKAITGCNIRGICALFFSALSTEMAVAGAYTHRLGWGACKQEKILSTVNQLGGWVSRERNNGVMMGREMRDEVLMSGATWRGPKYPAV
ncbi:hypothetical protein C8F04DRAFT_1186091 [Mycena alexandri]|uniref:Uncharacterized protein n=1 Tax=Mycena alexandri TaxID=1745969 RepID=A0AAD6SPI3_9AGAR|nr:hypothetical protein C8F04DRAFT_1186091 [Mycena alexandri]